MNTLKQVIRQDLSALKWLLVWWISLLVANHWIQFEFFSTQMDATYFMPIVSSVAVFMTSLFVVGRLAFNHPASGPAASWRTRPMAGWRVGVAKLLFGGVFLVLLPSLFALSIASGEFQWPAEDLLMKMGLLVSQHALILVLLLGIASLCHNGSEFALSLLGIVGVFLITGIIAFLQSLNARIGDYSPGTNRTMWLLMIGAMGAIFFRQYHRPNRLKHVGWLSCLVLVAIAVEFLQNPIHNGLKFIAPQNGKLVVHSLEPSPSPGHQLTEVSFKNLDPTYVWKLTAIFNPPNHADTRMSSFGGSSKLIQSPAINRQLELTDYEIEGPSSNPHGFGLSSPETGNNTSDTPGILKTLRTMTARLERVKLSPLGRVAIEPGASTNTPSLRMQLKGLSNQNGKTQVAFTLAIPNPPGRGSRITQGEGPLFVFVDHANRRASIVTHAKSGTRRSSSAGLLGRYVLELPTRWNYTPNSRLELLIADVSREGYILLEADSD